jgi:tetratricopeptide (TPR) repeat protein
VNEEILFPSYISRVEELQVRQEAAQVRADGKSRTVLLYGPGGVGKTWLVRQLARASADDPRTVWLDPIDIDDSEYWLLSNLERLVAHRLDPSNQYFGPYLEYLSRLPSYTRPRIGHETVVSHLGRIKRVFVECYTKFVEDSGKTVVIVFDTVEAIRGMYLLLTLTQWIKSLPATLFILSGRPLPGHGDRPDPIKNELEDPYQSIPVKTIRLDEFTQDAALDYLNNSSVASGLTRDEKAKLVCLTRGHPLWLAFTVSYLDGRGIPEETQAPLADIAREVPYRGDMTQAGHILHEEFKRRLVAPYRDTDFWHEAVKRLAVVRESVNQPIWQQIMSDRPLPEGVANLDEAWDELLHTPWIRPRANRRYVTLHDAVAEELAHRIIPLHDQDKHWRRELWLQAARIYRELTSSRETELAGKLATLEDALQLWDTRSRPEGERHPPTEEESGFIQDVAALDVQKRELCQLKAVRLYYEILCDFPEGCRQFLALLEQAKDEHDILFQDLLAFEMQRFLPGAVHAYAFGDVIGEVIDDFREWLSSEGQETYLDIGLSMADYLIRDEQPVMAIDLLARLPEAGADHRQRYRLSCLLGNACMRIPGRVKGGLAHFLHALDEARQLQSPDQLKLIAAAHKELGFYYRNEGLWDKADEAYQDARDAISETLSARSSEEDREEMASIQTNWAYVKGLGGSYRDGTNLVESAINVRHRLKKYQEEGISWSVCGEVYRYERRFQKAWKAYAEAEQIFQGQRNWSWLGLVYQEQAICLFQATQDGISLTPERDPIEQAKRLITLALDLCRDLAVRGQPSALNRAGRIFGQEDADAGLGYLAEGIDQARRLSDGWFWFANLIEYVELSYRAWASTRQRGYRDQIAGRAAEIDRVMSEYEFPDLKGRWNLLHGHLGIQDSLETGDGSQLGAALQHYKEGFAQIAQGYVGSSGAAAVAGEFKLFGELVWRLSPAVRAEWQDELRSAWSNLEHGSTVLLARLEELY